MGKERDWEMEGSERGKRGRDREKGEGEREREKRERKGRRGKGRGRGERGEGKGGEREGRECVVVKALQSRWASDAPSCGPHSLHAHNRLEFRYTDSWGCGEQGSASPGT